ncbi:MAG: signal recognition particle protein [Nitrospirae bacterium]|nr:signal recognition particle protein [Nitrospirota bacterium]
MLSSLSEKLEGVLDRLKGRGVLTEHNITDALREVRLALLEADVHFSVVKTFIDRVREQCLGAGVMESLSPGQQVVKIVHRELTDLMGKRNVALDLRPDDLSAVLMVGLQGSGKTTTVGKLARRLKADGKRVLMVACDLQRPAAIQQLITLGERIDVKVLAPRESGGDPVAAAREGLAHARANRYDVVLFDTAGRLHVDDALMAQLVQVKGAVQPHEVLLVADAMTGQEAVNIAERFHQALTVTGIILTKLEGDARGGAVLSMRQVTGCPVKFVGMGEKLDALEAFHPERMASRILGMGDVLSLIEKAEATISRKEAEQVADKVKKGGFTLEDFRDQLRQIKKMGSITDLLGMIPGAGKLAKSLPAAMPDKELGRVEAIINSMTVQERRNHTIINGSRRKRIAAGSGTSVQDVNRLLKNFAQGRKMMKQVAGAKGKPYKLRNMLPF